MYEFLPKTPDGQQAKLGEDYEADLKEITYRQIGRDAVFEFKEVIKEKSLDLITIWNIVKDWLPDIIIGTKYVTQKDIDNFHGYAEELIVRVRSGEFKYNLKEQNCVTITIDLLRKTGIPLSLDSKDEEVNYHPYYFMKHLVSTKFFNQVQKMRLDFDFNKKVLNWVKTRDIDKDIFLEYVEIKKVNRKRKKWIKQKQ